MIQRLIDLITRVVPQNYEVTYEESSMMNIIADSLNRDKGVIYIEEYRSGTYNAEKYGSSKTTHLQIYFCKFTELHDTALQRENLRKTIEQEAILPFLQAYRAEYLPLNSEQGGVQFTADVPRFDANEVSICLKLNVKEEICE